MQLTQEQIRSRYYEFPDAIKQIGHSVPVVRMVMDEYAHGNIITMHEALARMVVELANRSELAFSKLVKMCEKMPNPATIMPPVTMPLSGHPHTSLPTS